MKQFLKFHFLWHILVCMIAFTFLSNANAENARDNPLEGDMVQIPAGSFVFGTDKKDESAEALSLGVPKPWYADEGPEQSVFLKSFYIDRYEVTNQRYKIFVDDVSSVPPADWTGNEFPEGKGDFPTVNITWYDAANFCQWAGKKLPSEKQWEKSRPRGNWKCIPLGQ